MPFTTYSKMKSGIAVLLLSFLFVCGCRKTATGPDDKKSLVGVLETIQKKPELSLLNFAIARSKLDEVLAEGNVTVFAPTDSAFLKLGWNKEKLGQLAPESLRFVLSYLMVRGLVGSDNIAGFYKTFPNTLNADFKPAVSKNYYGLFFDGNHVEHANIRAGDGIIHEVEGISLPPVDSLIPTLFKQPDLTIFAAIFKRFDQYARPYFELENITILAPNDKAFLDSGYTLDRVNTMDSTELYKVFLSSLCDEYLGRMYSSDFIGGKSLYTTYYLAGTDLDPYYINYIYNISTDGKEIQPDYNAVLSGTNNIKIPPKFVRKNILSKGGIIHTLDRVFRP